MTDQSSSNSSSSLEEILAELEKKFSTVLESDDEKTPPARHSGNNNLNKANKTRILAGLTLLLVISGSVAGFYLTQTDQELRQQAQEAAPFANIQVVDTDIDLSFLITFSNTQVQSTVLTFTGPTSISITLNQQPFSVTAAAAGLSPGSYTVEAVGFAQTNGVGAVLERHTTNFVLPSR